MGIIDRFYAGEKSCSVPFIIAGCFVVVLLLGTLALGLNMKMDEPGAHHPHQWFAWHPVRLQGGDPIPSVQEGGRIVWMKNIERFRFFNHWVYREIGDKRELTR